MNDLEKMKKEVEQKKKALNAIYGKESIENNFAAFNESIRYIYNILNSKIENARYRYAFTKDPELKGEIDAYHDVITLLETKYTFLASTNNEDSKKIPSGFIRRLTVKVCPVCNSKTGTPTNIKLVNKISKVNNWDEQKVEKVSLVYECLNCGIRFIVLSNDSNNIKSTTKIPYSDGTNFCFNTKDDKDEQ